MTRGFWISAASGALNAQDIAGDWLGVIKAGPADLNTRCTSPKPPMAV
jgi:hypothetical protein